MANWYVSPAGASGNAGTLASPWDLASVADSTQHAGVINPGDTIWLLPGTYGRSVSTGGLPLTWTRSGAIGTGKDDRNGKIVVRNYLGDTDPLHAARANIQETLLTDAPTAGATTVNGVNASGSGTLSIHKVTNPEALEVGHQLTIGSGPGAGVYVVTVAATLVVGNTSVSIAPNLHGATAGGEVITLSLGYPGIDNLVVNASYVWFWGLELSTIQPHRTWEPTGGFNISTYQITNEGVKVIHCVLHDGCGNVVAGAKTGRFEMYGCILYNAGVALGDGGGHQIYIHHKDNGVQDIASFEGNVHFNDNGCSVQMYDAGSEYGDGGHVEYVSWVNNIGFNGGVLNNVTNLGGIDAQLWVCGGPQKAHHMNVTGNQGFQADGYGDIFVQVGQPGQLIGVAHVIANNYLYGAGSGYGSVRVGATADTVGAGHLTFTGNTMRVKQAYRNSRLVQTSQDLTTLPAFGTYYTFNNNTFYRKAGAGEPPILAFATPTGGPWQTLATYKTSTGQDAASTLADDPIATAICYLSIGKFEPCRGLICYYNYASLSTIPADLTQLGLVAGDTYIIHDVRNVWAGIGTDGGTPVIGPSIYNGGIVYLPTTQVADPTVVGALPGVGHETAPPVVAPFFNTFLVRKVPAVVNNPVAYDFYVSSDAATAAPGHGIGAGSISDPWSITYATGTGAGTAQGDGKLPTTGARIAMRIGTYDLTNLFIMAHGSVGTGVDNPDGKLIFEGYRSSTYALPERAHLHGITLPPGRSGDIDDLHLSGNYVWLKDLEISHEWTDRVTMINSGQGIWIDETSDGAKVIHCDIHDGVNGIYASYNDDISMSQGRVEIYGNCIRNSGWDASAGSAGHNLYLKHKFDGTNQRMLVQHNILGSTFALCCQLYSQSTSGLEEGIDYQNNIHFNGYTLSSGTFPRTGNLLVIGGQQAINDIVATDNLGYWPDGCGDVCIQVGYYGTGYSGVGATDGLLTVQRSYFRGGGYSDGCVHVEGRFSPKSDLTFKDNTFRPDLTSYAKNAVTTEDANPLTGYSWSGNTWLRDPTAAQGWASAGHPYDTWASWQTNTGLGGSDTATATDPTTTKVFVTPTTRYQLGRGHVTVFNWQLLSTIPVDLSPILAVGDEYVVHDNRDAWGTAILSGTYAGGTVNFPSTQVSDPAPIGGSPNPAPPTAPFFNAWIVRKTG